MTVPAERPEPAGRRPLGGAALVGIGILVSRFFGIFREMLRAQYLGATVGIVGDAWTVAIKIPNTLQNLLGEGVLSASFIPVYSKLLAEGDEEEAGRLAGAIAAILGVVLAVLVGVGVIFAPAIVHLLAGKFTGEKFALTVQLTRILFPGAALFVLAAWCIGVLSSHRQWLLAYLAPVFWNLTMIAAFLWFGPRLELAPLAKVVAWASVTGAALQFLVQLPSVLRLAKRLRVRFDHRRASVRRVLKNFAPVAMSRGVVQVSQFVDLLISARLPQGSVTLLATAQTVTMLPISLFGMAVSAAELPEMSSVVGSDDERAAKLRERVVAGVRRIAFFVVPSAVAFVVFGDVIIRVLYERGQFKPIDTVYAWGILAGAAFGLLASTIGRMYSSAFYAMHDTGRPFRIALIRISLSVVLGYLAAVPLTNALGIDRHWGAAALTLFSGFAGWVEFALLRKGLRERVGQVSIPSGYAMRLWSLAAAAALAGFAVENATGSLVGGIRPALQSFVVAVLVLGTFGAAYLAGATVMKLPEAGAITRRFRRH